MNLIEWLKKKYNNWRLERAVKLLGHYGFSVVKIERIAGSTYLRSPNGTLTKVGR